MRRPETFVEHPGEVQRIAGTDVFVMSRQPILCAFSSAISQMREKSPFRIEFAGNPKPEHRLLVVDRVDMHVAEALALEVLVVNDFPQEGERAQLFEEARV